MPMKAARTCRVDRCIADEAYQRLGRVQVNRLVPTRGARGLAASPRLDALARGQERDQEREDPVRPPPVEGGVERQADEHGERERRIDEAEPTVRPDRRARQQPPDPSLATPRAAITRTVAASRIMPTGDAAG